MLIKIIFKNYLFYYFQVFDDVAVELAMALLQFFNSKPSEEHLFRTMKALAKFVIVRRIKLNKD